VCVCVCVYVCVCVCVILYETDRQTEASYVILNNTAL